MFHLLLLGRLGPVELLSHDLHDPGQALLRRLHVQEGEAEALGDDVDGGGGVLVTGVADLKERRSFDVSKNKF